MIVDAHAHIVVPEILRERAPGEDWRPRWVHDPALGRHIVEYSGRRIASVMHEFVDPGGILAEMDRAGVDLVVLSPWVSLTRYDVPPAEGLASCRVQNDAIAALARERPDRIAGLGVVPLQDVPLAIAELERLMAAGLKGFEMGTHINGVYPGDAGFRPFWEACQSLGALAFIHPIEGGGRPELRDYYMANVVGNPIETAIAAAHLILSGTIEAYPRVRVLLAHGGGALPILRGRLDRGFAVRPEIKGAIPRPPGAYLRHFYFDTITHDAALLRDLVAAVGADRVLLGSDYPFDMGTDDPVGSVRAAELGAEAEARVLGGNAHELLGL